MEIKKLPENVKSLIQSGTAISDACQCVLELLYNSLDSKATAIAVRIDFKKFYIQVVDNGSGMSYEDLNIIGDRHTTSKCSSLEDLESHILTYGYRGVALASIVDACDRLEIQSRHSSCQNTHTRILKKNGSNEIHENQRKRPSHGTTVTVVNFMVSMPVRRKRIREVFDLDYIVQQIEALAIIHYSISFSLRNDATGKVIIQTCRRDSVHQSLHDQFGLSVEKNLIPINYREGTDEVSGFVCRHLHTDSSIQYLYVNNRVVHNPKIHKLISQLIKKYGQIWTTERINPEEIIDVDGLIYIIKIQCPYMNYSMSRSGRKTIAEFRNLENVLKCIIRAIKRRLKEENNLSMSAVSVYFDNPEQHAKKIGNPIFGPSQLNNVVHGRLVSRPFDNCVELNAEHRENKENLEEGFVNSMPPNHCTTTPSSVLQRYQKEFFSEINKDGSNLPDHVPIFEIRDFAHIPFHEFLAWLDLRAEHDNNALKLLTELTSGTFPSINQNSAAIVPLKDIRKEKLAASSKIMLKRIKKIRYTHIKRSILEHNTNVTPELLTRPISTPNHNQLHKFPVLSVISDKSKSSYEFPQVTFNEFLAWLKVKAAHSRTVENFLSDFLSAKGYLKNQPSIPPPMSLKELRREKLNQFNANLLNTLKTSHTKPLKRCLPSIIENKMKKKRKVLNENRTIVNNVENAECNYQEISLLSTWKSHYRNDSIRITNENENLPKNAVLCEDNIFDRRMTIPSPPMTQYLSINCNDDLNHSSEESINISKIDKCNNIQTLSKSIQEPSVENTHFPVQELPKTYQDEALQTSLTVANVSIQVNSVKQLVSSTTQTDEHSCGVDKEIQTILLETKCKEVNGVDKEIQTTLLETKCKEVNADLISRATANTSSLELPEVLRQSVLDCSPLILRNSLPDTVPAVSEWEEKFDSFGRKFYVHSSSGFSLFEPPISSTRSSFPISGVDSCNDSSKNFDQVQGVVTDSCQDDLAVVKWKNGNKDDVIDPILKMLQDASEDVCPESEIMSAKIPKEFMNSHKLLSSIVFSKELLKAAKVIGQLDKKFIVAIIPKEENSKCTLVCLFDQHGVHERITLEKLLKVYQTNEKCESEALETPLRLSVPLNTYNMFLSEEPHFNKQGLYGVAEKTSAISVTSVPACFVRQQEREMKAYKKPSLMRQVADLIEEITNHLCETRGAGLLIPKTTMAVIASQACRSAIKFNQILSVEETSKMISDLSLCNTPFQCAHGRPSVAPILELDKPLLPKATKLNFKKFIKKK